MSYSSFIKSIVITFLFVLFAMNLRGQNKQVVLFFESNSSPRIKFGIEHLASTLKSAGYKVYYEIKRSTSGLNMIFIGERSTHLITQTAKTFQLNVQSPGKEGYSIVSQGYRTIVAGSDASGILYGCLELSEEIKKTGRVPSALNITDQPEMVLRGQCVGLQKSTYLPGRTVYEYPYTPETFPWFYDKKLWLQVLDSMLENRMNSLYLWNGHPFASLVKLKDYPYAVEVDDTTFKKNEEMYRFITTEADKRGIWVIQMFYNIIVSKPFAEKNNIKTQDRERPIIPLIADYTRKSIAAFVEKYPNVGLMVCLGEAMEGTGNDDIEWFTKTIIPGVKDGVRALGKAGEPPIVLRAHDTDAPAVMKAALPLYKNLYTEAKFNGEALTYPRPRGTWAQLHQTLSKLGSVQIENVHILANLEPFRYGSTDFIQQSVIGMHEVMGGNGLHLYPQASYWDWPYSADSVKARPDDPVGRGKRLLQIERDWIWYKAWARYAWKAKRDRNAEIIYWSKLLANKFGCSIDNGKKILKAYEESGEIAPKLLRRFGITDGNRQTLTLGMLMTQLIDPYRYGLFTLLYDSESPEGEMLIEFTDKEWKKEKHIGETPEQVSLEVAIHGMAAASLINEASAGVTRNKEEFDRIVNDMNCYKALSYHFSKKVIAAQFVLKYKYSNDIQDLEKAEEPLQESVEHYKDLIRYTTGSYLYANSMQTQQRRIPMRGINGTYKHWKEMLPVFEAELKMFRRKIDSLKNNSATIAVQRTPLKKADVTLNARQFTIDSLVRPFSDTTFHIVSYASELKDLKGLQLNFSQQIKTGTQINFTCAKPVKLFVGFFKAPRTAFSRDSIFLKEPELETNATADDYGQSEIKIGNAIAITGMPPVNIHSYSFNAGTHELKLGRGVCLVLGFADGEQSIPVYDAMLMSDAKNKNLDWLFE